MESVNTLALYGTIIEIILILLIVLITVALKVIDYYRNKATVDMITDIKLFLIKKMKNHGQVESFRFKDEWRNIKILLFIITDFDKYHAGNDWLLIRSNFVRNIILPLARTASQSEDWRMRHYAAEAFGLYSENNDEEYIVKLINDKIPLVRYSAAAAGVIHGSEKAFDYTIRQMAKEKWLTQTIYMQGFNNIPSATHHFIVRLLKSSTDPSIKATCYNLLLKYPVFVSDWDIAEDTKSKDIKLALSATRYIAYNQKVSAVEALINLLRHTDWKMRAVATACLGDLKSTSTIHNISQRLNDDNWWVRFSARQALQKFGDAGNKELILKNIKADKINVDISQHVLNTL